MIPNMYNCCGQKFCLSGIETKVYLKLPYFLKYRQMTDEQIQIVWRRIGGRARYYRANLSQQGRSRCRYCNARVQTKTTESYQSEQAPVKAMCDETIVQPVIITNHADWLKATQEAEYQYTLDCHGIDVDIDFTECIDATEQIQLEQMNRR